MSRSASFTTAIIAPDLPLGVRRIGESALGGTSSRAGEGMGGSAFKGGCRAAARGRAPDGDDGGRSKVALRSLLTLVGC